MYPIRPWHTSTRSADSIFRFLAPNVQVAALVFVVKVIGRRLEPTIRLILELDDCLIGQCPSFRGVMPELYSIDHERGSVLPPDLCCR